jgi:hypothetical protein
MYRAIYDQSKILIASMTRYQAATDPAFNAAIDALFTPSEKAELAGMLNAVSVLVTDWETNHPLAVHGGS